MRCNYFVVTYTVLGFMSSKKNSQFSFFENNMGLTGGRTDTTSYTDAYSHLKKCNDGEQERAFHV